MEIEGVKEGDFCISSAQANHFFILAIYSLMPRWVCDVVADKLMEVDGKDVNVTSSGN